MPRKAKIPRFEPQEWVGPSDTDDSCSGYPDTLTNSNSNVSMDLPSLDSSGYPDRDSQVSNETPHLPLTEADEEVEEVDADYMNDVQDFIDVGNDEEDVTEVFYDTLDKFRKEWILSEITHKVSKCASNKFWELATHYFPLLHKLDPTFSNRIPQFQQQRNILHGLYVPPILMDLGYQHKVTKLYEHVHGVTSIPVSQFPPSTYSKCYEIAKVKVRILF